MKKILIGLATFSLTFIFARDLVPTVKVNPLIHSNQSSRHIEVDVSNPVSPSTREEIILHEENFEGDVSGWYTGGSAGWELSEYINPLDDDLPSQGYNSPDANDSGEFAAYDLFSPSISLPYLGEDEIMHFRFALNCDMPDHTGPLSEDGAGNYLADYYSVSLMNPEALAWHASGSTESESLDGNSYWCADEDVGGYLDNWIQFLDTPSFTVPQNGALTADMMWSIESDVGAVVAGSCTNGWDAANVRISADGGSTWSLLTADGGENAYDFSCGYGWIYNDVEYEFGGSLHHLASGWGNNREWTNMTFDLSAFSGQEVIVRFAFGSDPAYSTIDDSSITGFRVDNIAVSGTLDCSPEVDCAVSSSGEVWVEQFYDYGDTDRPGGTGWTDYLPGYPYNGNVFLDISDFAGQDVIFRFQTRTDGNLTEEDGTTMAQGTGFWLDDLVIYKESGGSYPAPQNLIAEAGDSEVMLSWNDMNASGTQDFTYDNDQFTNGISMVTEGSEGWAGTSFIFGAPSTVNSVSIYYDSSNPSDYDMDICAFETIGTLFGPEPSYCIAINTSHFIAGWNTLDVTDFGGSWEMSGSFIIGHTFSSTYAAFLDETVSWTDNHSYFNFTGTGGLGAWDAELSTDGSFEGEWGIRANVTFASANVTYNVYRNDAILAGGLSNNSHTDGNVENNMTYEYTVSATYADGEESGPSNMEIATPISITVHEDLHDDGTSEVGFNAGSANYAAVRFSANDVGEDLMRFKWYQTEDGGAFYVKVWEDSGGAPGEELYSEAIASGLLAGWNEKDLSDEGIVVSGDFWIGVREFSSSSPFGLDTSSDSGDSFQRVGLTGDWLAISGNLMFHVFLDCNDDCDDGCSASDLGDVNDDNSVNVQDIIHIVNFIMGTDIATVDEACVADLNEDDSINVQDIILVVNIIMGN